MTEGTTTAAARILVVEDEPLINQAVTDRLRAEGFVVEQAHDGPGAVAAFEEHAPDLVVLDLMLPGFDGLEVCRRIQATRPVPVLMLTARDDETDLLVGLGGRGRRLRHQAVLDARGRGPDPGPAAPRRAGRGAGGRRRRPHRRRRPGHRRRHPAGHRAAAPTCT